ncbi:MAG: DNA polymerase III subunit gamma/tau [Firmicutes bacterium]|nr:DNA polymerase III subunit gamma/tau [Bacillota bacterium]
MTYLSLNRRWRPRSFEEVTRQEHVTRTLQNAIRQGRVAQAYLFGGRRGTGKTTMARLLAKALNCQEADRPTPSPCGRCPSCEAIAAGTSPDVIELDAASNRGIDEIRALQENVHLLPMSGRYKVYIIDEAHQMTKDAYNAFLKTLEEPPRHVVFVLATTEPEKIIPTVRSRCQRFDFRPVPEPDIVARLKTVAEAEGIQAPDELLGLVARKAEGSLRDALGLLEQCVAFAGERPTVEDFLLVTGGLERDAVRRLAELVRTGRTALAVALLADLVRAGKDPHAVADGLISYLREVFLAGLRSGETAHDGPEADAPPDPQTAEDARRWALPLLVECLEVLVKASGEMRFSPQPRLVLEMALLRLCRAAGGDATGGGAPRSAAEPPPPPGSSPPPSASGPAGPRGTGPVPAASGVPAPGPASPVPAETGTGDRPQRVRPAPPAAVDGPPTLQWLRDNWEDLLDRVRRRSVFIRAYLLKARPTGLADGVLTLGFDAKFHKEQMEQEKNRRVLEEALREATGVELRVRCRILEEAEVASPRVVEPEPPPQAPAVPRERPVRLPAPGAPGRSGGTRATRTTGPRRDGGPAPARPVPSVPAAGTPPVPATGGPPSGPPGGGPGGETREGVLKPKTPETIRSALTIFGGKVVDDQAGDSDS